MMKNESRIAWLLAKSMKNELNDMEEAELANWLREAPNQEFVDKFLNMGALAEGIEVLSRMDKRGLQEKLNEMRFPGKPVERPDEQAYPDEADLGGRSAKVVPLYKYLAVACAVALLSIGIWWFFATKQDGRRDRMEANMVKQDIAPGGNKAILTLAGGERIVLDRAKNGKLAKQGNVDLVMAGNGQLSYDPGAGGIDTTPANSRIAFNVLSTPRGGQFRVLLSDGTQVWLNAASSIRYPAAFTGKDREVEITGEAYFEVSPRQDKPFKVRANGTEVQVLGTAFNVMAYENEAEQDITLAGGAVRVSRGDVSRLLKPGQQARLSASSEMKLVGEVDLEEILAWKNNLFSFNEASIETVMRQLSRWYDVDVKYAGIVSQHFNGNIPRGVSLSRVFEMLEQTGKVHFRIEGRQVTVMPV